MRMRSVVQLATPPIGYVRIELGRRQIRVSEHLLDRAEVGAPFEQVRREGVAQQVRMHTLRLEPGGRGEAAQDQEGARTRQRAALRVEKELGAMALVEIGAASRDVSLQGVR